VGRSTATSVIRWIGPSATPAASAICPAWAWARRTASARARARGSLSSSIEKPSCWTRTASPADWLAASMRPPAAAMSCSVAVTWLVTS
jgi:hypothetical protein